MTILGIETSCDETSAAVVRFDDTKSTLLSQSTATSLSLHAATGGIIPEGAAREQLKYILPVINQVMTETFPGWDDEKHTIPPIDAIAVTYGPGLIGSLLVGVETAKTLSLLWGKPLIPVNHLYGHIFANWLIANGKSLIERPYAIRHMPYAAIAFPAIALVVSGGHTDLVLMENEKNLKVIGGTRDDAAGEAFDKIGRLLGLSYPAGPEISHLAEKGDPKAFPLPRPMLGSKDFDFSFSGLKTAVLYLVKTNGWEFSSSVIPGTNGSEDSGISLDSNVRDPGQHTAARMTKNDNQLLPDICASFQQAIVDVLVKKTLKAAKEYNVKSILLGGGVAANDLLREQMEIQALRLLPDARFFVPAKSLCTDNAAMIAAAAYFNNKPVAWEKITADPELYY